MDPAHRVNRPHVAPERARDLLARHQLLMPAHKQQQKPKARRRQAQSHAISAKLLLGCVQLKWSEPEDRILALDWHALTGVVGPCPTCALPR